MATSTVDLLRRYESHNVTFVELDGSWPIVWERANGVHVWDETGKRYLDLTAAFGVAAAGHANSRVVAAACRQMGQLAHAMGDVHPHRLKAELARALSQLTFERWAKAARGGRRRAHWTHGKTIFCNSGFEAVEAALKTALLATGKRGVLVFEQAYHGLGYGALNATHRSHFRSRFVSQLREFGTFVPFPGVPATRSRSGKQEASTVEMIEPLLRRAFRKNAIGAILVEPVQVRGGVNIAPPGFLPLLRALCDETGALLILDEIYTGFGRTGRWFACEHSGVVPDLLCVGKAMTGGFPLSACVGGAELMDAAWPRSTGEAIHTSTFLGHPVGCAMALANIGELERRHLIERSARSGQFLLERLREITEVFHRGSRLQLRARGLGLVAGLHVAGPNGAPATSTVLGLVKWLLHEGFVFLPEGEHANVISFTPPLIISTTQLERALRALGGGLARLP
jgi:4-aminobutyrate aminotransferase-like enzyme